MRAALEKVRAIRSGTFVVAVGTGCCDSTAPFLFENHLVEPDARQVGKVDDVPVMAPAWLDESYRGETLVLDVREDPSGESFSAESELGLRLVLVNAEGRDAVGVSTGEASAPVRVAPPPVDREPGHAPRTPTLRPLEVPENFRHFLRSP